MLAAQSLCAIPVPQYQDAAATEYVVPLDSAEIPTAAVEDQKRGGKTTELRQSRSKTARASRTMIREARASARRARWPRWTRWWLRVARGRCGIRSAAMNGPYRDTAAQWRQSR
jgi:long-subunit acyl-CoA synthetase (AMP-forming)